MSGLRDASGWKALRRPAVTTATFQTTAWLYDVVRLAGAAYLVGFGLRLLNSARGVDDNAPRMAPAEPLTLPRWFLRGLVTDLSNPKAAVFFTGLFAVAIPPGSDLGSLLILVALIPGIAALWYGSVAVLMASRPLRRAYRQVERAVPALAGALLIAFGLRLALD